MDNISSSRLQIVHPALSYAVYQMEKFLDPLTFRVAQGLRSWEQQAVLWSQGRTTPGKIVTDAPAGYSQHNYGFAVDLYPNNTDGSIDWNPEHPDWKAMEKCGVSCGLVAGANWTRLIDAPHFELTGRFPSSTDDEMRQLFQSGGIRAVWRESGLDSPATDIATTYMMEG